MKKLFALVMTACLVLSLFAGCGASGASDADPNVIKIGMSGPLTGGAAVYGTAVEAGMKIAVAEINAAAEANGGLKIEFKAQDDEHDNEKALNAYNSLKDWGMQIFAGAVTTGPCLQIAPETVADQIFMMTPSGSSDKIALTGNNIFQMCFTDPNQGASAAELVHNLNLGTTIGIIYDNSDDYSKGLMQGFKEKAAEYGMNIAVETSFTADNKNDLSTQVTQCKDAGCDFVFLPFYAQEAAQVLTYANTIGYKPTFVGCDGMDGILTTEGFDPALAEGLMLLTPFSADSADEATQAFVKKYQEKTGILPNQFAADAYDVIYAIYQACNQGKVTVDMTAAEINEIMKAQFTSMTFSGLTGEGMTWLADGTVSKEAKAVVIENGKYVDVE